MPGLCSTRERLITSRSKRMAELVPSSEAIGSVISRRSSAQRHSNYNIHDHGDLYRGVPTIQIVSRIGFGDANSLREFDGFVERAAFLHFGEHDVGCGVQNTGEAAQIGGGKPQRKERKNGS